MTAEPPAPAASRPRPRRLLRLAAGCLLPLLLWIAAYQAPLALTLHIGGDVAGQRRFDEDPFLRGINGSEPPDRAPCPDATAAAPRQCWWWQLLAPGERPYRWTSGDTRVTIPGAGGGPFLIELRARGAPGAAPTRSRWRFAAGPTVEVSLAAGEPRRYRLLAPADPAGDLHLDLITAPFAAPGDPRDLGFVLSELRVSAATVGPRSPAWPQLGWLAVALAAIYGVARGLSAGPRASLTVALLAALVAALALALARPALTLFAPALAGLGLLAAAAAAIGRAATRGRPAAQAAFIRQVLALTLLALALRLGGMLHPHALYSDSGFHANKLYTLSLGQVFQTAGLPSEAGGGQAPYPTGAYILLLPGQLLLAGGQRVALLQAGTALLDSLAVTMIALLLAGAGLGRRAALLGAACYLLPVTALESFSIGELANLGGQAVAMPFVALLALGALGPGRRGAAPRPGLLAAATAALAAGLLAHSGVTLSLGALTAAAWGLALAAQLRGRPAAASPLRLSVAAGLALGLALLAYYSAPVYLNGIVGRLGGAGAGGGPSGAAPLAILRETAAGVLGLAPPRARAWPLPPLLGPLALAGLALLYVRRAAQPAAAGLRLALAAWWLGALLTQALLLVADQGLRWSLFLYPALGLSAGPLLDALWRRGRAGRAVAIAALAAIIVYGALVWVVQIRDYYHI